MMNKILKNRKTTFLVELGIFAAVATGFLLASKHFHYQPDTILFLGFILGIGTEKLTKWFDRKSEE